MNKQMEILIDWLYLEMAKYRVLEKKHAEVDKVEEIGDIAYQLAFSKCIIKIKEILNSVPQAEAPSVDDNEGKKKMCRLWQVYKCNRDKKCENCVYYY